MCSVHHCTTTTYLASRGNLSPVSGKMTVTRRLSYLVVSLVHFMAGLTVLLVETLKVTMSWKEGQTMVSLGEGFYCGAVFLTTASLALVQHRQSGTLSLVQIIPDTEL